MASGERVKRGPLKGHPSLRYSQISTSIMCWICGRISGGSGMPEVMLSLYAGPMISSWDSSTKRKLNAFYQSLTRDFISFLSRSTLRRPD